MKPGSDFWKRDAQTGIVLLKAGDKFHALSVQDWGEGVVRILIQKKKEEHHPPFLEGNGKDLKPIQGDSGELVYQAGESRFAINSTGIWQWSYKGKLLLEQTDDFYPSMQGLRAIVPGLQLDEESASLSFWLKPDEPIFGGGEVFGHLNKRRLNLHLRIYDSCGLTTTSYSYKHIPLFWSPGGWGIFVCTNYPVTADIGASSFISFLLRVEEPCLDVFLIPGRPGKIIKDYWRLTGIPPLPPVWALGVWWSRCMYKNFQEVEEVVKGLDQYKIKGSVISLDPLWLKNRPQWQGDSCDFIWNREAFGEQKQFCSWLEEHGLKLCLWENPYLWLEGDSFENLGKYLIKDEKGEILRVEPSLCGKGIVDRLEKQGAWDFTRQDAWDKRKNLHKELIRQGASCFKVDYGDGIPLDSLHNVYAFLYAKNTWESLAEERGEKEAMIWARPGWSGCQRYPGCWAGDSQSSFLAMASTLAGCLSLAASGVCWWSHDIGGFHHYTGQPPSPELYIRWAEWGLLSPLSRFHGTTPREPWHFGDKAIKAIRQLTRLRYSLIPYLIESYNKLLVRGLPLARPLVMDYPHDPATWDLSTEYLLGTNLLVCPVLEEGARKRTVYLPEGTWEKFGVKIGRPLEGPQWLECASAPGSPIVFKKV